MLHNLILGASLTGKTTLAKILCGRLRSRGVRTAVLDPLRDPAWHADRQYHRADDFLRFVRTGTAVAGDERWGLFIDESAIALDRDKRFDVLATTGRHLGCVSHFICFGLKQLTPAIRHQCLRRWVFKTTREHAKDLAGEHDEPELLNSPLLHVGEFYLVEPNEPLRRGRIVFGRKPRVEICSAATAAAR